MVEVVAFHIHGWCMLGVFLLLASTHLGHECQELLSPCDGMHLCTDLTSVYTLIWKSFGGMESEPMLTPKEKSPLLEAQGRFEPATLHHTGEPAQRTTDWAILAPMVLEWLMWDLNSRPLPGGLIETQTYKCFWASKASPQRDSSLESSETSSLPWLQTDSPTMSGLMSTLMGLQRRGWKMAVAESTPNS